VFFGLLASLAMVSTTLGDSTVYRCGPEGSQKYSQIPCSDDAEPMVIKEQHLLGDAGLLPADRGSDNASAGAANNAEAFIEQLEKQRREQLAEIDGTIASLKGPDANPAESEQIAASLAVLQATRNSIVSEYDAMILAAQQRIAKP